MKNYLTVYGYNNQYNKKDIATKIIIGAYYKALGTLLLKTSNILCKSVDTSLPLELNILLFFG